MDIKRAISLYSTIEYKKQTKQAEYRNRIIDTEIIQRVVWERAKVQRIRSTNWQVQNRQGDVKNSTGSRVTKELMCLTHGCELKGRLLEGMGDTRWRESKGENKEKCAGIKKYELYRIHRGMVKTIQEMEQPKNLYV